MTEPERAEVTYRGAGVDIDAGEDLVERIKPRVRRSLRREVLGGIGGFGESVARSSIATLVYAVSRRKDMPEFKATLEHIKQRIDQPVSMYPEYSRYYEAQALFQGDVIAWEKWNKLLVRQLKAAQKSDGSIQGQFGAALGTSMSLLALALNYRFLPIYER